MNDAFHTSAYLRPRRDERKEVKLPRIVILPPGTVSKPIEVPRIPEANINQIAPPILPPPQIPEPNIPEQPTEDIPSYDPLQYDPPQFIAPVEVPIPAPNNGVDVPTDSLEEEERELPDGVVDGTAGREVIEVPIVGEVPLPTSREVALAGTTAMAATAAALIGKSLVEWMIKRLKPIVKKGYLKIKQKLGQRFTDYELQLYFELEGKQVVKRLQAEQKDQKRKQLEAHLQRQHQRKLWRKGSRGGNKSQPAQPQHNEEA